MNNLLYKCITFSNIILTNNHIPILIIVLERVEITCQYNLENKKTYSEDLNRFNANIEGQGCY